MDNYDNTAEYKDEVESCDTIRRHFIIGLEEYNI